MNALEREELEQKAARVREHLLSTAEELERKSGHRLITSSDEPDEAALTSGLSGDEPSIEVAETGESSKDDGVETPERKQLERRADQVRERLADSVELLEKKARERLLPIVVTASALVLVFTAGFAWMFYRTMKLSRR